MVGVIVPPSVCSTVPSLYRVLSCLCPIGPASLRLHCVDRLVGLVVKASASRAGGPGIFSGSSHTSDLKIGTPVATLPGAWRYRVSTGTGRPGVSIL